MAVYLTLERIFAKHPNVIIRHGACGSGADSIADAWCVDNGVDVQPFPADWSRGRRGGPERNRAMLTTEPRPIGVVAFPGGRGTADMVRAAEAAGVPVWRPCGP